MSIPAPARPAAQAQPTYSLRRRLLLGTWAGFCWRY